MRRGSSRSMLRLHSLCGQFIAREPNKISKRLLQLFSATCDFVTRHARGQKLGIDRELSEIILPVRGTDETLENCCWVIPSRTRRVSMLKRRLTRRYASRADSDSSGTWRLRGRRRRRGVRVELAGSTRGVRLPA